jgi:hypothetical protein
MNPEPGRHPLASINIHKNKDSRKKCRTNDICNKWSVIIRKIVCHPPKEEDESRKK